MADRRSASISSRKRPQQARSSELVATILEAAVQVLAKQGAQRFTTARVAEKAGVSVGSLYQYFPNKAAILFRLQSDEWRQTGELLRGILEDAGEPVTLEVRRDGEKVANLSASVGQTIRVPAPIDHAGPNVVELEVAPIANELTTLNNKAVVTVETQPSRV